MDARFTVTRSGRRNQVVVSCAGDVDLACRNALVGALDLVLTLSPHRVVLDLGDVTFLDCSSMRLMDQLHASLPSDTAWTVICPPGPTRHVLSMGGYPSLQPAGAQAEHTHAQHGTWLRAVPSPPARRAGRRPRLTVVPRAVGRGAAGILGHVHPTHSGHRSGRG